MNQDSKKFNEFKETLEKIFQTDRSDLDFGIYRIMNLKSKEIYEFIEKDLRKYIHEEYKKLNNGLEELVKEKEKAVDVLREHRVPEEQIESNPKIKDFNMQISQTSSSNFFEDQIYSYCIDFFNRYYEDGDFVSKRRYKKDIYAIPYNGEEVKLHWANSDQYYVKTTEDFNNYTFLLPNKNKVTFYISEADTEKDNIKESDDKKRKFTLNLEESFSYVSNNELKISFSYIPNEEKQSKLNEKYVKEILQKFAKNDFLDLAKQIPTEKNKNRTLLEKHLTTYTTKNTSDYFIHKDIKGFLSRELDFYIKNEILYIDDLNEDLIKQNISKVKTFKSISLKIIDFISSIEELQKKLWLKKKFVIFTNYCITLDKLFMIEADSSERTREKIQLLLKKITLSSDQKNEWIDLGFIDESTDITINYLRENPFLVLDTKFFLDDKYFILSLFDNLESQINGTLINSDNFHALNLIQSTYRNKISTCYIDPPYNSPSSEILYLNNFKHSTWMTLIENRMEILKPMLTSNSVFECAIDKHEFSNLSKVLETVFPERENTCVAIVHNPRGVQGNNFSHTNEYTFFSYIEKNNSINEINRDPIIEEEFKDHGGESRRIDAKNCFYPIIVDSKLNIIGFGDVCEENYHPETKNEKIGNCTYIYPIDAKGIERKWVFARHTVEGIKEKLFAKYKNKTKEIEIYRIKDKMQPRTVWYGEKYDASTFGSKILNNIIPNNIFDFPKSIYNVIDCIKSGSSDNSIILDFFAGSGTSGHAVLELNRENIKSKRKFILVEMGKHFNSVIKPRIVKCTYSNEWEAGKPLNKNGISSFIKYFNLESYEDALGNIEFNSLSKEKLNSLPISTQKDYFLNYMLDIESQNSILKIEAFNNPFDYKLNVINENNEIISTRVDLVETFNYLIGLEVETIQEVSDILIITGKTSDNKNTLVLWRDTSKTNNSELNKFMDKQRFNSKDNEFDTIYINGDNNIQNVIQENDQEIFKVKIIEAEFKKRMFSN